MGPFTLLVITCYFIQSHTNKKGCNQNTNNQTYWTSTPNFNFFWPDVNSINSKYKVRAVRNRQRVPSGCWWIRLYLRGRQRGEGRGLCDCVFGLHVGKKSLGLELLSPNQSQMSVPDRKPILNTDQGVRHYYSITTHFTHWDPGPEWRVKSNISRRAILVFHL